MIINSNDREKRKEREERTPFHVGGTLSIPFWEITVELKGIWKHYQKRNIQKKTHVKNKKWKKIQVKCLINVWTTRTEKKEREGRTAFHVDDTFRIPFWEITVERKGMWKHYQKRNIQKKKYDNDKKWKKKDSC